jgi:hypothetical protein
MHGKTSRIHRASSELSLIKNTPKNPLIGSGSENSPLVENIVHNIHVEDHFTKLLEI